MRPPLNVTVRPWNLRWACLSDVASQSSDRVAEICGLRLLQIDSFSDLCRQVDTQYPHSPSTSPIASPLAAATVEYALAAPAFDDSICATASVRSAHTPSPATAVSNRRFSLYYVTDESNWFSTRHRVQSDLDLADYIKIRGNDFMTWFPLLVWFELSSCHESPHKEDGPVHLDDASFPALLSNTGQSASRNSWNQTKFSNKVLRRDNGVCVACRFQSRRNQAAHIYPLRGKRAGSHVDAGITDLNALANGLTLCEGCHLKLDSGEWCLDPVDQESIIVSPALLQKEPEWSTRTKARLPKSGLAHWPSSSLLAVQFAFFTSQDEKRAKYVLSRPFICDRCPKRYVQSARRDKYMLQCEGDDFEN